MSEVLSLGSVNADFQMRVQQAPEGSGTSLAHDLLRTSGGKAGNVAVLARRLGADARLLACIGTDDLADQAMAGPRQAGVDVTSVRQVPGPTGFSAIFVSPDGDKAIVLAMNANDAWPDDVQWVARRVAESSPGSVLVADLEVPVPAVTAAMRAARDRQMPGVLDPSPARRVSDELLSLADHVTPDHREAQELTGIDPATDEDAFGAADVLRDRGAAAAYVRLSSGGCAMVTGDERAVIRAPTGIEVVDKTGAGDAFAGAFGWALATGRRPKDAAVLAVAASSCAVGAYGSQEAYPSLPALEAMSARVVEASAHG